LDKALKDSGNQSIHLKNSIMSGKVTSSRSDDKVKRDNTRNEFEIMFLTEASFS
jgi:hypothetical protein